MPCDTIFLPYFYDSENKENLQRELSKLTSLEESFKQETEFWQVTMNNRKVELLQKIELF